LRNRSQRVFRARVDGHLRPDDETCGGYYIDEMAALLPPEDRQGLGDPEKRAFQVDIDHLLPVVDPKVVEGRDRADAGVVDVDIKAAEPRKRRGDDGCHIRAPSDV